MDRSYLSDVSEPVSNRRPRTYRKKRARRYTKQLLRTRTMNGYSAPKKIKQRYFPSGTALQVNTQMSYTATSGILVGPGGSSTGGGYFSLVFRFDDLPQQSTMASLFDRYKLNKWQVRFIPVMQGVNASSSVSNQANTSTIQNLATVIDHDDNTVPTAISQLLEYDNFQLCNYAQEHVRTFHPTVTKAVFASGAFSGYSVEKGPNPYIDMANTDVPHYGIKGGCIGSSGGLNYQQQWQVICTAWFELDNIR